MLTEPYSRFCADVDATGIIRYECHTPAHTSTNMSGYGGGYDYSADNNGFNQFNGGNNVGNGGFLNSSQGNAGGSPGTARQNRDKQSVTPLTIKQALSATHTESDEKPKVGLQDPNRALRRILCFKGVSAHGPYQC